MGVVDAAEDLRLRRRVALKFLHDRLARDPRARQRLEREARAASSLSHPNICVIHSVEEHDDQPVIVMELLEGESLRESIGRGPMAAGALIDLAMQACDALEAAHGEGIVHRDIKPANLFVMPDGRLKVLDLDSPNPSEGRANSAWRSPSLTKDWSRGLRRICLRNKRAEKISTSARTFFRSVLFSMSWLLPAGHSRQETPS